MQVSPANDQNDVYIATDREVNNVIEFLSRSRDFPPDGSPSKAEDFEREPPVGDPRDYPYPSRGYEPFSSSDFSYHDRTWMRDGRDHERAQEVDAGRSGGSRIGPEERYSRPVDNHRSRSSSSSPGPGGGSVDGKRDGKYSQTYTEMFSPSLIEGMVGGCLLGEFLSTTKCNAPPSSPTSKVHCTYMYITTKALQGCMSQVCWLGRTWLCVTRSLLG